VLSRAGAPPAGASPAAAAETEAHGDGIVGMLARAVNFAVFAGTLLFLHSRFGRLAGRSA
jgi:hypothetical protein